MSGAGELRVGEETSAVRAGDAVPIFAGEAHSVTAAGAQDLELMILGIALRKGAPDAPARE
jgi:quercetin dioxygenase-like cupin family protein